MPEHIRPSRGHPEQWKFDQSVDSDKGTFPLGLAVSPGGTTLSDADLAALGITRAEAEEANQPGVITSRLVRVQIHYTPGPGTNLAEEERYTHADGSFYYTARVSLRQMRDDLLKPRPRPLARLLESWSGLGDRAIATVLDVALANS